MALPQYVKPDVESWLKKFRFSTPIKIRFSETDALGHLNNVSHFIYFEQGRLDYFSHLGIVDQLLDMSTGDMIVAADLECHYLAQIYFGEPLDLYVRSARLGRSSLDIEYALVLKEKNQLAAVGRGAVVYMDKKSNKSKPIPDGIRQAICNFEEEVLRK
ncbi:acyl-CoA thioesterase [Microaerobacter geothermalis]|uniref:acyl-CoA thioesterase n=1 Tax=Microaerobacter geothermalis TaxID=674972 RepID=UPI001F3BF53D|nr:thioesterase family protein [Microaerobacter geothermalis]MCF6092622.1 acyl-CoA thioesterase [Microaerobacter geothermalis]